MTTTKEEAERIALEKIRAQDAEEARKIEEARTPTVAPVPAKRPANELIVSDTGLALPKSVEEQLRLADAAMRSGVVPASFKTKEQVWVAMQRGVELGFKPYAALDVLYPVNGRLRLTPAGAKALALQSGLLADCSERLEGEGADRVAVVTVLRKGIPTPTVGRFSYTDAKRAGLVNKDNWKAYEDRMLLARARGFAFMDAFGDLVGGMQVREVFDLDPSEALGDHKTEPVARLIPPATFDPMIAALGLAQADGDNGDRT